MIKLKSLSLVLAVISAAPLATLADGPTSRPVNRPGIDRGPDRNGNDRPDRPRQFRQGAAARVPTGDQWTQILAFMEEKSPRRTEELKNLIETADEKRANLLKSLIAAQYDYVTSLKTEDSQLYDLQIKKIAAQDEIYGMLRDLPKGAAMPADQKKKFREQVAVLVDVNLGERGRRIEKARDSLAKAQATLDQDSKDKESMVDDRVKQFINEGARPFKLESSPAVPPGPQSPGDQGAKADDAHHDAYAAADQQLNAILLASWSR